MKHYILALAAVFVILTESAYSQVPIGNKFKKEFLERINSTRQKGCNCGNTYMPPVDPVTWNDVLENAAKGHAKDMAKKNYFSHESKNGRSIKDRIFSAGYDYTGFKSYQIGENIAQGQESIEEVTNGWFKSKEHCKNLMNAGFKEVGIAYYDTYWVQDFGGREPFSDEMKDKIKSGKYRIIQRQVH